MKFYNREKEVRYLKTYCQLEPNSILFVYGPKSSGKSTVIRRVIKELEDSDIVFFYYNLRKYATPTKEEFFKIFFERSDKKYVPNKLEFNLGVFKFGVEKELNFKEFSLNDVFAKINESINEVIKEGKRPVLIIDELQKLKNIYFNGEKSLLNELFNLFVSLTKMEHLSHVICLTSDTLFIEEIYQNSTLENASEYYLIDWLEKEDIKKILKEENFNEKEIDYAINYLSLPYEITELINNKKLGLTVEETIKKWINIEKDKLLYLLANANVDEDKINTILSKFKNNVKVEAKEIIKKDLINEFKFLVNNEVLFYDIINGIIKPTSIKKWHAIKKLKI